MSLKKSIKQPLLFRIKARITAKIHQFPSSAYFYFRFTNPFYIGALIFLLFFVRLCNNDSGNKGVEYFEKGEFNMAMDHYNEYLLLHPHHIKTIYNRGRCYDEMGFPEKAAEDYEQVLERDSHNIKALLSLSQYYYKAEKYEFAINLCASATMIEKQNYLAHYYKGRAHHKIGEFSSALSAYNSAIEINPEFGFAYFHRSSLLFSIGMTPFGCLDLQTAENLDVAGATEALDKYCRKTLKN